MYRKPKLRFLMDIEHPSIQGSSFEQDARQRHDELFTRRLTLSLAHTEIDNIQFEDMPTIWKSPPRECVIHIRKTLQCNVECTPTGEIYLLRMVM